MGTFESKYSAIITAKLANGKEYKFHDRGTAKSITFVDAASHCKSVPPKDVPKGITPKKGVDHKPGKAGKRAEGNVLAKLAAGVKHAVHFSA